MTSEIVCAQYKRGNSSLYLIFLLICQFIIEFTDVDAFVAALDIGLLLCFISFLWLYLVERLLIVHYRLNVSYHYYSFVVNSLKWHFCYCPLLIVNSLFRVSHLFEYQLLEIFKVWSFLMQFIKRNFWWHTCLFISWGIDLIARYVVHHC